MAIYGDTAGSISGHAKGLGQKLNGVADQSNDLFGDSDNLLDFASGGKDKLTGGNNAHGLSIDNRMYGDARVMSDATLGGDDTLSGGKEVSTARTAAHGAGFRPHLFFPYA